MSEVTLVLADVSRAWSFLENLFIHSEEVKKELPNESEKFVDIDRNVKEILANGAEVENVKRFCNQEDML